MVEKIKVVKKESLVDGLFEEVQDEINEDVVKDAKIKIKELLQQRLKAEKVLKNLDRQIDDLKLKINQELA